MNFSTDKARVRILGSMLSQHIGDSVCLLGTLVQLDPNGRMLKMKTTDDHLITVQLKEPWFKVNDLTDDEVKKVDTRLIYWMPPYDTEKKMNPLCFEKYLSNYWKEHLQRMLMTDDIHNLFSTHKISGCCDKFDKERNIYKVFQFSDSNMIELMKAMHIFDDDDDSDEHEKEVQTVIEVCMKDVCILKPQVAVCTTHDNCFVKICHNENCSEPFLCRGETPCVLSCETKIKNGKKKQKKTNGKFWKTVSVELYPVDKKKCDASTLAESYNRDINTYLHLRRTGDFDFPFSMMSAYHCMEFHNFDFNQRKAECLNRLRKKLSQKHPSMVPLFNPSALRQPYYRESLLEKALEKMMKLEAQYCFSRDHQVEKCGGKCFNRDMNSVAISSSNPCGRVVSLSKITVSIPSDLHYNCCCHPCDSPESRKTSLPKNSPVKKIEKNDKSSKSSVKIKPDENCVRSSSETDTSSETVDLSVSQSTAVGNLNQEPENPAVDDDEEDSKIEIDDDIDEICKLIGIGEENDSAATCDNNHQDQTGFDIDITEIVGKDNEAVNNFLKLIGASNQSPEKGVPSISQAENLNKGKLRMCAYCKKKETRRKMFKKCSRCKEDNFPVHHYYCSEECLMEDWAESHEDEHLKFKKNFSN